jgi:hypothetical protein
MSHQHTTPVAANLTGSGPAVMTAADIVPPVIIGHTFAYCDGSEPIFTEPRGPRRAALDLRCQCGEKIYICRMPGPGGTVIVVEHKRACPWLLMATRGRAAA